MNKKYIDDCNAFTCCYILYLQISSNMSSKSKKMRMNWEVPASKMSHQTFNPIRNIVDTMKLTPNPDKEMIALSIGKLYISYRQFKNVFYNKRCMHTALTTKYLFLLGFMLYFSSWIIMVVLVFFIFLWLHLLSFKLCWICCCMDNQRVFVTKNIL